MPTGKKVHAVPRDQPTRLEEIDALLDEALRETFPASDPIAISFDAPGRKDPKAGTKSD